MKSKHIFCVIRLFASTFTIAFAFAFAFGFASFARVRVRVRLFVCVCVFERQALLVDLFSNHITLMQSWLMFTRLDDNSQSGGYGGCIGHSVTRQYSLL
jgi:hypothetical protein